MVRFYSIISLALLSSCAAYVPLTNAEKNVKIYRKSDPPAECVELQRVLASGFSDESRDEDLKRSTYGVGGDTVLILKLEDNLLYGMAFKCKQ